MRRLAAPALLLAALAVTPASAQIRILGGPNPGVKAPEFTLPAATRTGVSTAEYPFELWKTTGQVVVLAFYPRNFTATGTLQWKLFAEQRDSLFGAATVIGLSPDSVENHARWARSLDLPFVMLADSGGAVARRYGALQSDGEFRRAMYVLRKDGRVHYRDMSFDPRDPRDLADLRSAVRDAATR